MKNLYDILQVSENASDEIIEKAYKTLVKKYHPDLQPKEKKQVAEAMMKSLNEAYEILSDPTKREKYDRERAEIRRQQEAEREAKLQKEQVYHTQERSVPRQEEFRQEPIRQTEEQQTTKEETFLGYMGNLVTGVFSKRNRERRKVQNAYREGYQDAYASYWRAQGYQVKEPWNLKRIKELVKSIAIFAIVLLAIWFFPPTHNFLVETYESNEMLKGLVDSIIQFFKRFFENLFS